MTTRVAGFNQSKADEFAGQFLGALNGASVVALASVGSRTGLFDAMAALPPSTSEQIAQTAGLNQRYVQEWLGGMVLGRVVDYDAATKTYSLPAEHAAFLASTAGADNLSVIAQIIASLETVESELVQSFRNGGGVPYASYSNFQSLQASTTAAYMDASLVQAVLPLAPGVVERLEAGADALDIGTGAGHAVNVMAAAFPNSRFAGYDFSEEGIQLGIEEATAKGLTNAAFAVRDIAAISEPAKYDLVTAIELVHDLAQPSRVLREVYESLKPEGTFLVVDIAASSNLEENLDHLLGPALFMFSVFHCMTVSLAQGGAGLGTVVGEQKLTRLLHEAGFRSVEVRRLDGDFFYAYFIARK